MDIQEFIGNFAEQFDDVEISSLTVDTEFKNLDEWTSLAGISIIAMFDEYYGISVTGNDIRKAETIGDLFKLVHGE